MSERGGERVLSGPWARVVTALAFCYGSFHLYTAVMGPFSPIVQRPILVGGASVLIFILYSYRKGRSSRPLSWWETLVILLAVGSTAYFVANSARIIAHPTVAVGWDLGVSVIFMILLLEATRRVLGPMITLLAILFLLYGYFGAYVPGIFGHPGLDFILIQEILFLTTDGIWGTIPAVITNIVAIFILFGALMLSCGLGKVMIDVVVLLGGRAVGGAAKVAVLASAFFGMISGSAVANIALTGSMTIPMMKRLGYKPEFAAATEATASTGGQIMPPIMGAGAFLIAQFVGLPYVRIIAAAALPALLYFFGTWVGVHFYSIKVGLKGLPRERIPSVRDVLTWDKVGRLALPVVVLLVLLFMGFSVAMAGFWATVAIIVPYLVVGDLTKRGMRQRVLDVLRGIVNGGRGLVMIGIIAGTCQIIVTLITTTPFAVTFGQAIINLSAGMPVLVLPLTAILCVIAGMGMPTTAAYVVTISLTLPILHWYGLELLVAHLFIFYFAILSSISPPTMTSIFVAAPMAGANWLKTAYIALRLASGGFIVPFVFVIWPALLLLGSPLQIIYITAKTALGIVCIMSVAMQQLKTRLRLYESVLLLVAASALFLSGWWYISLVGLILLVFVWLLNILHGRARAERPS